jgi:Tetratricopeptide repeat
MTWIQTEFLLKGLYLGLLLTIAIQGPSPRQLAIVGACTAGGLAVCLAVAAFSKLREGYRVGGKLAGFVLFLLLENPRLVFAGLVIGLAVGSRVAFWGSDYEQDWWSLAPAAGGAVLGILFLVMRQVRDRRLRNWLGLGLAATMIGGGFGVLHFLNPLTDPFTLGVLLLAGLPGFYLLTFSSLVEESEVEVAAMCGALGVGLWIVSGEYVSTNFSYVLLVFPLAIYYVYTRNVLPGLRVFKHTLRGLSYRQIGQYRQALASLNRALQLDPNYALAREQLWELHRELDLNLLKQEPEILRAIDYQLCLERVAELLLRDKPQAPHLGEALRLLELIASQRTDLEPCCQYWRAVAYTHQKQFDIAAAQLEALLQSPVDSAARRSVQFAAWHLALFLHPEMQRRVGKLLLAHPDRRLDAIAAAERKLSQQADDAAGWEMKRLLYSELTEGDYNAAVPTGKSAVDFDHAYVQQLGLALIDDPQRWQRGCEYLRIAARGLPAQAPALFIQIAKAHEKHNDAEGQWDSYRKAMLVGRAVGVKNLAEEDRKQLAAVVKSLGERAMKANELDAALEAYKFYTQFEQGQLETYRTLAELFERKAKQLETGQPQQSKENIWLALNCTEHALSYNGADANLLARKDSYYYSLTPDDLKPKLAEAPWFDVDYCLAKSRSVLDRYNGDLDLLDWAGHLAALARVAKPSALAPRLLSARVHRLRGETGEATALLEEIRQNKPAKFGSEEEEDAWFVAHRLLGDIYLDTQAEQAVQCFQEFKKSPRSGADTAYKLGRAYENLGDLRRAAIYYDEVTTFPEHPLYYEARDGLDRVKRGGAAVM